MYRYLGKNQLTTLPKDLEQFFAPDLPFSSIIPAKNCFQQPFALPMSQEEMHSLGWDSIDILLVSGDAYIDHPSFGTALLGRLLVAHGFKVGVVAQPSWEERSLALQELSAMGRPKLFVGITAGAIDSLLAHYTAFRKKRSDDAYTPGGKSGARPNRATIVYTGLVRQAFPDIFVVLGGIEASLRRVAHYDFWSDSLRRPLLCDSKADLLSYGMGEYSILAVAFALQSAVEQENEDPPRHLKEKKRWLIERCQQISGIASLSSNQPKKLAEKIGFSLCEHLPSYENMLSSPPLLMEATLTMEKHVHQGEKFLLQQSGAQTVIVAPPTPLLTESELDFLYSLPYSRLPHPRYKDPIPAWEMIRTSITTHRGCGGGCSFCSLALHQGRRIASRSEGSILKEAKSIAAPTGKAHNQPRWKGSISDVGGPTANMWQATCSHEKARSCTRASCLFPAICPFFQVDQKKGVALLRAIAKQDGVRHVRVASGVRFDLALKDDKALFAYTSEFTGGQLKVAPEHSSAPVLALMRKPSMETFERFLDRFALHARTTIKDLYTVPYLMSAFPGCTMGDMKELSAWLQRKNWQPKQVQCFIPTPGTVATAMFYAEIDPKGEHIYVAKTDSERLKQHHMLFAHHTDKPKRSFVTKNFSPDKAMARKHVGKKNENNGKQMFNQGTFSRKG